MNLISTLGFSTALEQHHTRVWMYDHMRPVTQFETEHFVDEHMRTLTDPACDKKKALQMIYCKLNQAYTFLQISLTPLSCSFVCQWFVQRPGLILADNYKVCNRATSAFSIELVPSILGLLTLKDQVDWWMTVKKRSYIRLWVAQQGRAWLFVHSRHHFSEKSHSPSFSRVQKKKAHWEVGCY